MVIETQSGEYRSQQILSGALYCLLPELYASARDASQSAVKKRSRGTELCSRLLCAIVAEKSDVPRLLLGVSKDNVDREDVRKV